VQVATPDLKAAALSLRLRRKASTEDYKVRKWRKGNNTMKKDRNDYEDEIEERVREIREGSCTERS
jgi:hypothetical protein